MMQPNDAAPRCEYPSDDPCGEPAVWTTDDLQEVHHLCVEHCIDAFLSNDFVTEPVMS